MDFKGPGYTVNDPREMLVKLIDDLKKEKIKTKVLFGLVSVSIVLSIIALFI